MGPVVLAVAGTSILLTGSEGLKEMFITWHALPVSPAKGSFPQGKSLLWWKRKSSVVYIMTACWII